MLGQKDDSVAAWAKLSHIFIVVSDVFGFRTWDK